MSEEKIIQPGVSEGKQSQPNVSEGKLDIQPSVSEGGWYSQVWVTRK